VQTGEQMVKISPNPFDDAIIIKTSLKGVLNVSIYDVLGKLLYNTSKKNDDGMVRIPQPDLASGAYIVSVQSGDYVETQRVVKK
jgi:hypothetical protein